MPKYSVKRSFKDIKTGEIYKTNDVIDFSKTRAKEADKNLKAAVDDKTAVFFEEIETTEK